MNSKRLSVFWIVVYSLASLLIISVANAASYVWTKETPNYRIYMGIVPAELVQHQPRLLDEDKRLHNVRPGEKTGMSHMVVWVYHKPGNARVLDATLIAEVDPASGEKTIKPLEKMKLGLGVSYGNFFKVHQNSEHTVTLKIFNLNSNGFEEVVFTHQGY